MKDTAYISVVIPVFNEEGSLLKLFSEVRKALDGITGKSCEVIFVDDGSRDGSPKILRDMQKENRNVKVITFCRNFGQHAAVMAGFRTASGDIIVTLDADLQNPPDEIPKLVKKIEEGFEVGSGWRMNRKDNIVRRLSSEVMNAIISRLTGVKLNDYGCMLRAYKRGVIDRLLEFGEKSVYIPAFTSWLSSNVAEVPVKHSSRKHGRSKYNFLKFLRQAFDLITAYTLMPIQLISIIGAVFSIIGFSLACYLMSFRLFFGTPSALTTFISVLLILSGLTILFLGIVSEYIVRVYIESRKLPLYIIKEESDKTGEGA